MPNRVNMKFLPLIFLVISASCGFQFKSTSPVNSFIHGSVPSLAGLVSKKSEHSFYAYAASCEGTVSLYALNANDEIINPAIATTPVNSDGSFSIGLENKLAIAANVDHILEVTTEGGGCDVLMQRPLTDPEDEQVVTYFSTILSYARSAQLNKKIVEVSKVEMEKLLEGTSNVLTLNEAYTKMSGAKAQEFTDVFSDAPTKLEDAAPVIKEISLPGNVIHEGSVNNWRISAYHWKPDYDIVVQWKIENQTVASIPQLTFSPGGDASGSKTLEVYVGVDDGTGKVDLTRPYHYFPHQFTIANNILPAPPQLATNSTLVSDENVSIKVLTGAGLVNCQSFSSMAITVDDSTPPAFYPLDCTMPNSQDESITLTPGDGTKTIRLWVRDHEGNISSTASTLALTLDKTVPFASLTAPAGTLKGGSVVSIPVSATDAHLSGFKIQFSSDGTTFSDVANLSLGATTYNWTIPVIDSSSAKLRIVATDSAGNISYTESGSLVIDSTAPTAPSISLTTANPTNQLLANFTIVSCADRPKVIFTQTAVAPLQNDAGWEDCSTVASAHSLTLSTADGVKTVYGWAKDAVGNVSSSSSLNVTLDRTQPALALISLNGGEILKGGDSFSISYNSSDANFAANPIALSFSSDSGTTWSSVGTSSNSGSFSWSIPAGLDSTTCRVKLTATDSAGNSRVAVSSSDFSIDSSAPVFSASAFILNSGATLTNNNFIKTSFSAQDSISNITHFCLRYNFTTEPLVGDACWIPVNAPSPGLTPDKNLTVSDFNFPVGFGTGAYTIYGWVKDQAGNISTLSNSNSGTVGLDKNTIGYDPGESPTVINVGAYSSDSPSDPTTSSDLNVPSGGQVFIKWKATDDYGLPSNPVKLYYTTNDTTYNLITGDLPNAQGSGCTLTPDTTGCYVWTQNITSGYLKIRVAVTDSSMMSSFSAASINSGSINFLAGNTDPGVNGSAASALFFSEMSVVHHSDPGSLVVTASGSIFFRDINRGILTVNPADGILKVLVPTTGASSGDGGNVASATLRMPLRIYLDHQNRILIYDYDRIRRVDTNVSPMTITTIIGGGASTADGISPLNVSFVHPGSYSSTNVKWMPFFSLPNGDIYFQSDNFGAAAPNARTRRLNAATNLVESIRPSGTGAYNYPANDLTVNAVRGLGLVYNPVTSEILHMHTRVNQVVTGDTHQPAANLDLSTHVSTGPHPVFISGPHGTGYHQGRDGKLYGINRHGSRLNRFDHVTNTIVPIAGTGTRGFCVDGTLALSCNIDPQDMFVNSFGQIFYIDRGLIRTITSENKILTLYGQNMAFGDGGKPLSARFGRLSDLHFGNNGEFVTMDFNENRIRAFNPAGVISTIAGNGNFSTSMNTSIQANTQLIRQSLRMGFNPATSEVFILNGSSISKLNRTSGLWENISGGGGTSYSAADGLTGANINYTSLNGFVPFGFDGTNLLALIWKWVSGTGTHDYFYKLNDGSTGAQTHLAGVTGVTPGYCANGAALATCGVSSSSAIYSSYDSLTQKWYIGIAASNSIKVLSQGGNMASMTLPAAIRSIAFRRLANNDEVLYYCSNVDGKLYRYNMTASTNTALTWAVSTVSCQEGSMSYNSGRNSVSFIYKQNNLYGVAEYIDP